MINLQAKYIELYGTNYEIGQEMGHIVANIPPLKAWLTSGWQALNAEDGVLAMDLFERWCPGLNEEIQGMADVLNVKPIQVTYYAMTYLKPGCSQMVLLPQLTQSHHVMLARNYDFSHQFEEFTLTRTSVQGKFTHLGTSVMLFGRDEGLNDHGLAVSMSSCGYPVGAMEKMRKPALRGLQFWAVIRTILENCADVGESLLYIKDMPIAYNINLLLADCSGNAALVETLDGKMAVKRIDSKGEQHYLHATNHVVLSELMQFEPEVMKNSLQRYQIIDQYLTAANNITADQLKELLLGEYPHGLCCHFYDVFFGNTKSIIMDLNDGRIDLCWGGLAENGWQSHFVTQPMEEGTQSIDIMQKNAPPGFFEMVPR